ncbi:MAG: hypothetical protein QOF59_3184 [Actinomycetota bacterium]|jgi:hypothetical protein|nr:hypothetical protein [Actinomycetota bacterium]
MRFHVEHEFAGPPSAVAEILCDPAFHTSLNLPDLSRPEVLESTRSAEQRMLRLRYEFVGHLDPIARRILAGRKLTWIQELRLDPATGIGRLTFEAESDPERLHGAADVRLVAIPTGTRRRIDGEFFVKVPLVGGTAERRIVPGLVTRMDVEAAALTAALSAT